VPIESWLLFVLVCVMAAATPGPGNLLVISSCVYYGAGASFLVIFGILTGLLSLSALAITGFSAVLDSSPQLFRLVQFAGGSYVLYLGIRMLRSPSVLEGPGQRVAVRRAHRFFFEGVAVSVANPKSIAFFAALLPPFIDPKGDLGVQYSILISTQMVTALMVLSTYSLSTRRLSPLLRAYGGVFNKVTGGLFIALALAFIGLGRS
jgi:homoserine/homoserine lactone efflux protein